MENILNILYFLRVNILFDLSLAGICGVIYWLSLYFTKLRWINTFHVFLTYVLLPIITYVVTKIISNNIALALGMVGALSIVRFRNPVKSPFELTMYFALITTGIAMSVNREFAILFSIFVSLLIFMISYIRFRKKIFSNIMNDEIDSRFYIEVITLKHFDTSKFNDFLIEEIQFESESEYIKKFACNDIEKINEIKNYIYEKCEKKVIRKVATNFEN